MYRLTLSHEERKAIDWVGYRYSNGDDLFKLLWGQCGVTINLPRPDCDIEWNGPYDITFEIPEPIAWAIAENAEQEDGSWPCFSDELVNKMQALVDSIV